MLSGKFFLSVFAIAFTIILIQWFFVGFLFHKYQAETPGTWRKEGTRSYAGSMLISVIFAFMFATLFYLWKEKTGSMGYGDALKFSLILWFSFSFLSEIGGAIFVNFSKMFVLGKCISSFLEFLGSGLVAAALL